MHVRGTATLVVGSVTVDSRPVRGLGTARSRGGGTLSLNEPRPAARQVTEGTRCRRVSQSTDRARGWGPHLPCPPRANAPPQGSLKKYLKGTANAVPHWWWGSGHATPKRAALAREHLMPMGSVLRQEGLWPPFSPGRSAGPRSDEGERVGSHAASQVLGTAHGSAAPSHWEAGQARPTASCLSPR